MLGFESDRAYLGHVRPSYTDAGISCAKQLSVGSSIASEMAVAITTGHPTFNWRDDPQIEPVVQEREETPCTEF